jgi:glycosyltransferase involved in cell wall biosynthesis
MDLSDRIRLAFVTNFPSYHNVDLFNALSMKHELEIKVFYLQHMPPGRQWSILRHIEHAHQFLPIWRPRSYFYLNPGLVKAVLRFDPDLLIITQYASVGQQLLMYTWSLLGRAWIFWSEAPAVQCSEHQIVKNERLRRALRRAALLPLGFGPRQVWAVGERARVAYKSVTRTPCVNVPYYLNQQAFNNIVRAGVRGQPVRFLFVGKLIQRKGIDLLLEAAERLAEKRADFSLFVLGNGPERHRENTLSPAARSCVKFLGFRELDEVPLVYAACDVLVFPTRYDGWGLAVLEAMSSGMPMIASRGCASAVENIYEGETGYLVDVDDVEGIVRAMEMVVDAPETILPMGAHAREKARAYSDEVGADRILYLIQRMI